MRIWVDDAVLNDFIAGAHEAQFANTHDTRVAPDWWAKSPACNRASSVKVAEPRFRIEDRTRIVVLKLTGTSRTNAVAHPGRA